MRTTRTQQALTALLCLTAALTSARAAEVLVTPTGAVAALAFTPPAPGLGFFPVGNLVNNSGLAPAPTLANYATVTHAAASSANAWTTDDPAPGGGDWFAEGNAAVVLTLPLGGLHDLTAMVYWGYHFGAPNGNEARAFTVAFSADGGASYPRSVNVARPAGSFAAAAAVTLPFGDTIRADTVRVTITDNHFGSTAGGDRIGLGEVKFTGTPVQSPAPVIGLPPGIVDFGDHPASSPEVVREIAVANRGPEQSLVIGRVQLTGADAPRFRILTIPGPIGPGSTASLRIAWTPGSEAGCRAAALTLESNDPQRPSATIGLIASAACPPEDPLPPVFSAAPGTFADPFSLTVSSPSPGAWVISTTDGTAPSLTNGQLVVAPIEVTRSMMVRAAAFRRDRMSAVTSAGYVKLSPALRDRTSPLPILVVENFGAGPVPDKGWTTNAQTGAGLRQRPRQPTFVSLHDRPAPGARAALLGPSRLATRAGIRVRGAFSSTWFPKPYSLEAWNESDADRAIAPLGMAEESDWILYHPHPSYDVPMICNTFIWELSRRTGRWAPDFRHVDVYVNEDGGDLEPADRRGLYVLVESVKRDAARLDFAPLSSDGASGGFLLGINRMDPEPETGFPAPNGAMSPQFFRTAGPNRVLQTTPNNPAQTGDDIPVQYNAFINFESPGGYDINAAQRAAIEGWFRNFEDVLYDNARWRDPATGYRRHLDTRDFIDYFQLLNLARQGDGLLLSMHPWVSSADRRLRMGPMWDFNNNSYHLSGNPESTLFFRQNHLWYPRLFADPDFMMEYIDRWWELRRGPYANAAMTAIADSLAVAITDEMAAVHGVSATAWSSRLTAMKSYLTRRADWIDTQHVRPPNLSPAPGPQPGPVVLTLTNSAAEAGAIHYTLDGTDPRGPDGTPRGLRYTGPVPLSGSAVVKARTLTGTTARWSGLAEGLFIIGVPAGAANLVISELHYNPPGAGDPREFLELMNIAATPIDLTGVRADAGVQFTSPVGSTLAPGERAIVVANPADFPASGGPRVLAVFTDGSRLDNGGERLRLRGWDGSIVREFTWGDRSPWPEPPDGEGPSLTLRRPRLNPDPSDAANWRPSRAAGGSPGTDDALAFTGNAGDDTDDDGIPDLVAHALGTAGTTRGPELPSFVDGGLRWRLPFEPAAEDVEIIPEWSTDLRLWQPATSLFTAPVERSFDSTGGWMTLSAPALPPQRSLYLRIRVSRHSAN